MFSFSDFYVFVFWFLCFRFLIFMFLDFMIFLFFMVCVFSPFLHFYDFYGFYVFYVFCFYVCFLFVWLFSLVCKSLWLCMLWFVSVGLCVRCSDVGRMRFYGFYVFENFSVFDFL